MYIYTPNLGLGVAVLIRDREKGCLRGSIESKKQQAESNVERHWAWRRALPFACEHATCRSTNQLAKASTEETPKPRSLEAIWMILFVFFAACQEISVKMWMEYTKDQGFILTHPAFRVSRPSWCLQRLQEWIAFQYPRAMKVLATTPRHWRMGLYIISTPQETSILEQGHRVPPDFSSQHDGHELVLEEPSIVPAMSAGTRSWANAV